MRLTASGSWVEAAARVRPAVSSITWAVMWWRLRWTQRRGRAGVPVTRRRTRRWRRVRAASRSCLVYILVRPRLLALACLAGLPGLPPDPLPPVEDALALVGLGLAERADLGGHLAHHLFVGPAHHDLGRCRDLDGHPLRGRVADRVGIPDGQHQVGALAGGAEAHANQVEVAGESGADPLHHVGDQGPG